MQLLYIYYYQLYISNNSIAVNIVINIIIGIITITIFLFLSRCWVMVVSVSRHIWMSFFFFWKELSPLYYNIFQRHRILYFRNIWLEYFILYTFFPVHFVFYDALEWLPSNESLEKLHRIFFMAFLWGKDRVISNRAVWKCDFVSLRTNGREDDEECALLTLE